MNLAAGDPHPQYQKESELGIAGGYCALPNPLDPTLPLRADGTPNWPTSLHYLSEGLGTSMTTYFLPWVGSAIGAGTAAIISGTANHPGIVRITSAAGLTGIRFMLDLQTFLIQGTESHTFWLRPQTLANSILRFGFHDTTSSADATDGCYIEMAQVAGVDGTIVGKTAAAAARSTTATSFLLTTNTWYRLRVAVNAAANLVTFSCFSEAGALLWTDTLNTNIPTAPGQETGSAIVALSSGTVAICDIDAIQLDITRPLVR
jgi:hypothetical protein